MSMNPSSMDRREWLRLAMGSTAALGCPGLYAAERTSRWDDESIARYSQRLINWLMENFSQRARTLDQHTGELYILEYDYLAPTDDRRKLRMLEKFEEGRLSRRAAEDHISEALKELEHIRVGLAEAEKKAAAEWKPEEVPKEAKKGKVFDLDLVSTRFTVILDASNSMTPYLQKLRDEITRDFKDAYIVEVNGCHLDRDDGVPWFYSAPMDGVNPFTPDRHIPKVPTWDDHPYSRFIGWTRALPSAIDCMVDLMKTDLLYWFCDFDDDDHDAVVKRLGKKILDNNVSLYVHTVDRRPPELIKLLAERSGGQLIKKRI